MSWISDRLSEKTSQAALAAALTATGTVASISASYQSWTAWLGLIPVWIGSIITVCLPEATVEKAAPVADPIPEVPHDVQ